MAHIAGEVTIAAPIDEVFDLVADERNEPRYNPRIVRAEKVGDAPVGKGARFVAEPKGLGAKGAMTMQVLDYERPHRLRTSVRSSYMRVDGTLTFDEVDGRTRLRWDWDMGLLGPMRVPRATASSSATRRSPSSAAVTPRSRRRPSSRASPARSR